MIEKVRGETRPTILRHLLPIAAVLLLAAVLVAPVAADSVSTAQDLKNKLEAGTNVELTADINITTGYNIVIPAGKDVKITGNGHTIYRDVGNVFLINVTNSKLTLIGGTGGLTIHGNNTNYGNQEYGLIYVTGSNSQLTINSGVTITNSSLATTSGHNGAGVNVSNGALFLLNGGSIVNNSARLGGGVYVLNANMTMNAGLISNNTVPEGSGGGIFIQASANQNDKNPNKNKLIITNGEVSNNTAKWGGGIYGYYAAIIELSGNAKVIYNSALMQGGGIDNDQGTLNLTDSATISHNSVTTGDSQSTRGGGGVWQANSNSVLNMRGHATISHNTAIGQTNGSGVSTGTVNMYDYASISYNSADKNGGGIYDAVVSMFNSAAISDNKAGINGGGVSLLSNGVVNMHDSATISNNKAAGLGGGIYTAQSHLRVSLADSAIIEESNALHLAGNTNYINVTGTSFDGSVKNITGSTNLIAKNYPIIKISADSTILASEILNQFALNSAHSNTLTLAPESGDKKIIITTNYPTVDYIQLTPWNSTTVNLTFTTLATGGNSEKVKINLTNTTNSADVFSAELPETIAAGNRPANDIQITGLTAGSKYTLNITLFATGEKASPVYEHTGEYESPAYLTISTAPSLSGIVGSAYTVTLGIVGAGTTFTWSNTTALPEWLTLDGATGVLSGTPIKVETQTFKIKVVSNRGEEVEKEFTLTISPVPPTPSSSGSSGSSVWLMETQTPTPTITPTETETAPTDIPVTQPTEAESPGFGVLAVMVGLGAVAVLRRR